MSALRVKMVVAGAVIAMLCAAGGAYAAPVKLVTFSHIGWEVDKTTKAGICLVSSNDECQSGTPSSEPGGFQDPFGAAADAEGHVYVADTVNHRVQELTENGEFILMFGREVNKTKDGVAGATQAEKDVCTEQEIKASGVVCTAGKTSTAADALSTPQSIAFDPATKDLYVEDYGNSRVDEYTSGGKLVWTAGREVNQTEDVKPGASTAQKNLCTVTSGDSCGAGVQGTLESEEEEVFDFSILSGGLLSVGGKSSGTLYVADGHRVAEIGSGGEWLGEIKLSSTIVSPNPTGTISAIAAGEGTLYLVYGAGSPGISANVVYEFEEASGDQKLAKIEVGSAEDTISAIGLDQSGHLAVTFTEGSNVPSPQFGYLYNTIDDQHPLTKFSVPGLSNLHRVDGVSFNSSGDLYIVVPTPQEIIRYAPEPVGEPITEPASCVIGPELNTSTTYDCNLNGLVNPYKVPETEAWFEWGRTCAFGKETERQTFPSVEELLGVNAPLQEIRPHEKFCYQIVGSDQNLPLASERLTGEPIEFETPVAPPKIVGAPEAIFVKPFSADLYGELNPEGAATEYFFEYALYEREKYTLASCRGVTKQIAEERERKECVGVMTTEALESDVYGRIGATFELQGLQPGARYEFRLAVRREGERILKSGEEESFFQTEAGKGKSSEETKTSPNEPETVIPVPGPVSLLPVPAIPFPSSTSGGPPSIKCKAGYDRNKRGVCVKAKKKKRVSKKAAKGRRSGVRKGGKRS